MFLYVMAWILFLVTTPTMLYTVYVVFYEVHAKPWLADQLYWGRIFTTMCIWIACGYWIFDKW